MVELGVYSDFPSFSHLVVRLQLKRTGLNAVALIARAMKRLNGSEDRIDVSVAKHSGSITVNRGFEVGIAEGLCFNFLDESELTRVVELMVKPTSVDYIVYVNYRYLREGRLNNLLPDRYIIRFSLSPSEIRLFQLSGLRRTDPETLISIIAGLINREAIAHGYKGNVIDIDDYQEPQKN
jgi:hypothetical protein